MADEVSSMRVGSSIPVPNVQELAANYDGLSEISDRYIRPEIDAEPIISDSHVHLPIIDLSRLLDSKFCEEESAKLAIACEEWGFFQLVNHGIPMELMKKIKADIIEFFELPLKEKEAYSQLPDSLEGYGQAFVTSNEQKLDWADLLYIITQPHAFRNLRFWPTHPSTFRDTLDRYSLAQKEVAHNLLEHMGRILGLSQETKLKKLNYQSQAMRINYYPPCLNANKVLGLSPHTDGVGLTLLLQVTETQGLQIKKDGKWFPIQVLPDALIINIGDILEIMSNGRFKSIEHRAIINSEKKRLSIATFHSPTNEVMVAPLPELVKENGEKYKSMGYEDYMKAYFSSKLDGRGLLEKIKLTN